MVILYMCILYGVKDRPTQLLAVVQVRLAYLLNLLNLQQWPGLLLQELLLRQPVGCLEGAQSLLHHRHRQQLLLPQLVGSQL